LGPRAVLYVVGKRKSFAPAGNGNPASIPSLYQLRYTSYYDETFLYCNIVVVSCGRIYSIVTYRPIARERVDKHVSMEMDSWKPTRYGKRFRGYRVLVINRRSLGPSRRYIRVSRS
jgi:hypothetical protein